MGKTLAIIGHRPNRLYGYNDRTPYNGLLSRIQGDLKVLIDFGFDTFLFDGGQGASQLAFWAVEGLRREGAKVSTKIMAPYKGQQYRWNEYRQMLDCAKTVEYCMPMPPKNKDDAVALMQECGHRIVDAADAVYGIYQGTAENYRIDRSATAETLRYARTNKKEILLTMPHQPEMPEKEESAS